MHVGKPENKLGLCSMGVAYFFFLGGDDVVWRVVRQGLFLADLELTSSLNWLAQ